MSDAPKIHDDPATAALAERLTRDRPVPSAAFRSALHRRLTALEASSPAHGRPSRFWTRVNLLAGSGSILLALVGIGVAGAGPFAP
jgi:hypothetical protein